MTPGSASGSPALPKALTPKQLALQVGFKSLFFATF